MEIKRCTRAEYPAFLDMVNDAFNYGAANEWFQRNMGNCTPYPDFAADDEIGNHFIALCDGHVVGAVGAYPMDWVVSNLLGEQAVIKAYGIGQVSCKAEYRSQGVMTALLKAAEQAMMEQGALLGFLGGDRFRYGRFGYDFGGNTVRYTLTKWRFGHTPPEGLSVREAGFDDWETLNAAYSALPSYIARDKRCWERQFNRKCFRWYIGELAGKKGYIAYKTPGEIVEIYGDSDTAAAMLHDALARHEVDAMHVRYPMLNGVPDAMGAMLYREASHICNEYLDLLAVIDAPRLLNTVAPLLDGIFPQGAACLTGNDALELVRRLVGYAYRPLPQSLKGYEKVTPLCIWLSSVDDV